MIITAHLDQAFSLYFLPHICSSPLPLSSSLSLLMRQRERRRLQAQQPLGKLLCQLKESDAHPTLLPSCSRRVRRNWRDQTRLCASTGNEGLLA